MTEREKMISGLPYKAFSAELVAMRSKAKELCRAINQLSPHDTSTLRLLLTALLGSVGEHVEILPNFFCDYGWNITIGDNFFSNHNLVILDCAKVSFGNNVFIGPNCGFYTARHPIDVTERQQGLEDAKPITVGNDVWIGGGVHVLPGVSIGDGVVIGAGSVVTHSIEAHTVAYGNPCRVQRTLVKDS